MGKRFPVSGQAFTLMELVVVVAIIGIMTAMIIPEMKGTFEDARLRATGRDLVNVFSLASSRAISLNESCRVQLDTRAGRYMVEREVRDGPREDFILLKDVSGAAGKLDPTIAIEVRPADPLATDDTANSPAENRAPDAISFYADGTADAAEIRLRDRDGFQLILQLNAVTARVKIVEPPHE